jgi:uncharacterized lipoprotein YehR (DUF1307 family)
MMHLSTSRSALLYSGKIFNKKMFGLKTNDSRLTREIKSRIAMKKAAFNSNKTLHQQIGLKFREEASKMLLHLEHASSNVWC